MDIKIRIANEKDFDKIEFIVRESFWNIYTPGCDEHLIIHNIHKNNKSINDLELVAEYENEIIGHIVYTKGQIKGLDNNTFISFGPLCVIPEYQSKGIGANIVNTSINKAKELGYSAVFITGNPSYYNKLGFESASKYGIYMEGISKEEEAPFFMVKVLKENVLDNIEGEYVFDEVFSVNSEDIDEFDKKFPYKIKEVRPGQLW